MGNLTIMDIARIAGVSRTTVSRVINGNPNVAEGTRKQILAVIKENDYVPNVLAQSLKSGSRTVGVVSLDISNPYFTSVVYSLEKKLRQNSYSMYYMNAENDKTVEAQCLQDLLARQVDGIVLLSTMLTDEDTILQTCKQKVPMVVVEGIVKGIDSINTNNQEGSLEVMQYFAKNGHKYIAFCANTLGVWSYQIRHQAYSLHMQSSLGEVPKGFSCIGEDFCQQFGKLVSGSHPPTAVFCVNDSHAISLYEYCNNNNLCIPEDVSIIGFDDLPISKLLAPRLTTISLPLHNMGEMAADMIMERIIDGNTGRKGLNVGISTQLKIRNSVKQIL